jgi:hypothetical protein
MNAATLTPFLTNAQRRVLNVVHERAVPNNARRVLERADASVGELDQLASDFGLLATYAYSGTPVSVANLHATGHPQFGLVAVELTDRGRRWVAGNPTNVLLRSIDGKTGKRMTLAEALGFSDRKTISDAVEADLLSLHHTATQEPVSQRGRTAVIMPGEFSHAGAYTINATSKIRKVLG